MQNWNDGKAQEFRDRKVYDIANSRMTHAERTDCEVKVSAAAEEVPACEPDNTVILFATETCPNCKLAASWLEKEGIPYTKLFVSEHKDEAVRLGLKQAPTLVVTKNGESELFSGIANVKKYIDLTTK